MVGKIEDGLYYIEGNIIPLHKIDFISYDWKVHDNIRLTKGTLPYGNSEYKVAYGEFLVSTHDDYEPPRSILKDLIQKIDSERLCTNDIDLHITLYVNGTPIELKCQIIKIHGLKFKHNNSLIEDSLKNYTMKEYTDKLLKSVPTTQKNLQIK